MKAFTAATASKECDHPIGVVDKSQLESCNEFGKGCFSVVYVGQLKPGLETQAPGRLARPVPMEVGDIVPVDGYKAHHVSSGPWQPTHAGSERVTQQRQRGAVHKVRGAAQAGARA